ncbi:MAG: DUF2189 domain-containing protein [Burkholderiaceae bacterium]
MQTKVIMYRRLSMASIARAIRQGWAVFSQSRSVSVAYAMIFMVIGLLILAAIAQADVAPMMLPLAGGFMLIGPILLCGFFSVADRVIKKSPTQFSDVLAGFSQASRQILVLALVCMLLFIIWLTDAATLYGFMVGRTPMSLLGLIPPPDNVWSFILWSSVLGAVLAFVIFAISAFSVPLLYYRRTELIQAIVLSVRVVFGNFVPGIAWAFILSGAIIGSILLLPLFLLTFPVLAYASHALYHEIFPPPES